MKLVAETNSNVPLPAALFRYSLAFGPESSLDTFKSHTEQTAAVGGEQLCGKTDDLF